LLIKLPLFISMVAAPDAVIVAPDVISIPCADKSAGK
jgi:mitochondrial fission protein ELM1